MASKEEYCSGEFDECPNCECTKAGTIIYKCKESLVTSEDDHCGKVFCDECGKITLMSFGHGGNEGCPSCDSFGSMIGEIKSEVSENNTGEQESSDDDIDSSYNTDSSTNYTSGASVSAKKESESGGLPLGVRLLWFVVVILFIYNTGKDRFPALQENKPKVEAQVSIPSAQIMEEPKQAPSPKPEIAPGPVLTEPSSIYGEIHYH